MIRRLNIFCIWALVMINAAEVHAQRKKIDSLLSLLKETKEDTSKVKHFNDLAFAFQFSDADSTILLAQQAITLAEKLKFRKGEASGYGMVGLGCNAKGDYTLALENYFTALKLDETINNKNGIAKWLGLIGLANRDQGNYVKALDYCFKSLKIAEEVGNKLVQTGALGNIGSIYLSQGDYPMALDHFFRALKISEEIGNKSGIAILLGNIGIVYTDQGDYPKALDYYLKALKIAEEVGNKNGIAIKLGNIGNIYNHQGDNAKALDYYLRALKIGEELGDKNRIAVQLGNIGSVYNAMGDYLKALVYYNKAIKICEEIGDKNGIARHLANIGSFYTDRMESAPSIEKEVLANKAEKYLLEALKLNKEIGVIDGEQYSESILSILYEKTGKFQLAMEHYKKAMSLKDSLFNQEKNKELTRKEMNYEFEKKEAAAKAEQDKKDAVTKIVIYSVSAGFALVLLLAIFIFRGYRQKQKANVIISEQKLLVEEKQKEILDSIHYAKRIQKAHLPPEKYISKKLIELKDKTT